MENKESNPKGIFGVLSRIHIIITFALFAVGIFFYWLRDEWDTNLSDLSYIFPYALLIFAVLGIMTSRLLFNRHMELSKTLNTLGAKLNAYLTASMIKYTCLEVPGFFGLFAAKETGNTAYLIITGAMVLILIAERPTMENIIKDLKLDRESKIEFERAMNVKDSRSV